MLEETFKDFQSKYQIGSYVRCEWKSKKDTTAKHKDGKVIKISNGVVRLGVKYENLQSIKEKGIKVQPLTYGEYVKGSERYLIEHKGQKYVRLYTSKSKNHKTHSKYLLNGVEVDRQYLIDNGVCTEKMLGSSKELDCFNVKLENLNILKSGE